MRILVGYDGSKVASAAIKLARKHAMVFAAKVELVASMDSGTENNVQKIRATEKNLEYAQGLFKKDAIPCETHLLIRGLSPGEDLVQFAKENNIDQIIVGVRRRSKVGKILLGSTAQYVILNAPCPVLTVK
jgi:nucleotide-binding universal stress UspA family protein